MSVLQRERLAKGKGGRKQTHTKRVSLSEFTMVMFKRIEVILDMRDTALFNRPSTEERIIHDI
jgi:hypothetical protein